jgi:acyl carrier protein
MVQNTVDADELVNISTQTERARVIEDWLVDRLAKMVRVAHDDIDVREPFANYGLGSYQGVELAGEIADWLGREVPETLVWDYPTIEDVAHHLSQST